MEERQEIQVKTLPWMSEDDTKHTSKAKKKSHVGWRSFSSNARKRHLFGPKRKLSSCV